MQRLMPGVRGQYARLYAMGIDSYNLLANLKLLQEQPGRTFSGKSGTLYLDTHNRLHRLLAWADMQRGSASIIGYAPRMELPVFMPAAEEYQLPAEQPTSETQPMSESPPVSETPPIEESATQL